MKKKTIILMFLGLLLIPTMSPKAETLLDYKNALNKYIKEQTDTNNKIKETNNQINLSQNKIQSIKQELVAMSQEIETMKEDIVKYNNTIKAKEVESKEIVSYYQMSQHENLYLDYAFGAETITDLIYRMSVVDQIISHNNQVIDDLTKAIEANQKREVELKEKEVEMNHQEEELSKKISQLAGVKASLNDNSISTSKQIEQYKQLVSNYEKQGCKDNDRIGIDCAKGNVNVLFSKPYYNGYVTSFVDYRWGSLHRGIDLGSSQGKGTPLYSIGYGTVTKRYQDSYGANCLIIEYKMSDGTYYSALYAHMNGYGSNIYVGRTVTPNDIVGYMGETGMAYGVHLHLEVYPCRILNLLDKNCGKWDNYLNYAASLFKKGFKGAQNVIAFPSKTYVKWSGK